MRKLKLLFMLCLFCLISMGASAYDFEATNSDGKIIYYHITSSSSTDLTCEVTFYSQGFDNCNHYLGDISVPSSVTNNGKTYIVTGIGHEAFDGCSGMGSIIIPNTVESIGQSAFYNCTGLTSITIPSSVKSIGRWAFLGCKGLTKVDIADINKWAEIDFYDSSANPLDYAKNLFLNGEIVKEATLTSATKIGNYAFVNCTCMESITIPNSVSKIGSGAFNGCSGITSITIPNSVLNIGRNAFDGCSGITSITIPNSILSIEDGAFSNCSGLTEVTLNSNSIVSKDYTYLISLRSIFGGQVQNYIIGDAVKSIGHSAFSRCNIKSVTISNSVTSIGEGAFCECSELTSILIPKSCINIGKKAFVGCHNLAAIEVDNDNPNYNSHINCNAIIETATNTLVVGCKNTIIPNNVTIIGESAFYDCDGLTAINIPEGVTSIGESAFYKCTGLTKVAIPISVADIGNRAFDGCSDLRSLIVYWKRPISITSDVFNNIDKTSCTLFVPEGSWSIYCTTSIWSDFTNIEETIIATSISLNSSTANLTIGTTETLTATVLPEDATDKSVTWSSDNESVATVADGVVTAVAVGTVHITAKTNDGSNLSATCAITVNPKTINVASIAITPTTANLKVGDAETLTLTILPEDAEDKSVIWSSDNESVATVVDGVVTAVAAGTANITVKTNDGSNLSATCVVTVTSKETPSEDIEPSTDISKFTNVLYINDVEARQGSELSLPLNMKNAEENITAFECKVYLPAGVEWAYTIDKRGNKIFVQPTFNEERTDANYHTINSIKQMEDGGYYVIVYSDKKEIILDKDGAILYMPLTVSEEIEPADYNIFVKDIVIVNENTEQVLIDKTVSKLTVPSYTIGDANDDGMINITDVVAVISYMLKESPNPFIFKAADVNCDEMINVTDVVGIIDIMTSGASSAKPEMAMAKKAVKKSAKTGNSLEIVPFTIAAGTTSMNVALELNNPGDEFTALECKVFLPEGVDWDYTIDRRGNKIYKQPTFNEDRTDANYHTINSISKVDGGYYVIVYSDKKEIFLDEDGALLYLPLVFDENINPGVYDIRVGDIVLARPDVTQELLDDYTASVLVGSPEIASLSLNGNFTAKAIGEYNTALASNTKVAAIDFSNATDVDASTAIATGNRNLLVYVAEGKNVKNENNAVIGDACANLVLTDGYSFCAPKAFTAAKASYTRTAPSGYATICLPFAPSTDGVIFYELKSDDEKSLTFSCVESPVANIPYLYKATKDVMISSNVEINTDGAGSLSKGDWTMTGTYTSREFNAMDNVFAMSNGILYRNTGTLTVNPFRAYFTTSGTAAKAEIFIETPTGIENIAPSNSEGNDALFNIQGIMVNKDYRGIKISQGKKHLSK